LNANVTSYTNIGLTPDTEYSYYVEAYNDIGIGQSDIKGARTWENPPPPLERTTIIVDSVTARPNTTIPLNVNIEYPPAYANVTAVQFDIRDTGGAIESIIGATTQQEKIIDDESIDAGSTRFVVYGENQNPLTSASSIARFYIRIREAAQSGDIIISNVTASDANASRVQTDIRNGYITIE